MKSTKFWAVLVGAIFLCAAAASLLLFRGRGQGGTAMLYQDGTLIRTIDLSAVTEPYSFTVDWAGGYNVVSVEHGRICVTEADCPDQICVRQGWISNDVAPIACLPHKLVIQITAAPGEIDGVAS